MIAKPKIGMLVVDLSSNEVGVITDFIDYSTYVDDVDENCYVGVEMCLTGVVIPYFGTARLKHIGQVKSVKKESWINNL